MEFRQVSRNDVRSAPAEESAEFFHTAIITRSYL